MRTATYPSAPGYKGTKTSAEAAASVERSSKHVRERVLATLRAAYPRGMTPFEIYQLIGTETVTKLSIRSRVSELKNEGLLKDQEDPDGNLVKRLDPETRRNAAAIVAIPPKPQQMSLIK